MVTSEPSNYRYNDYNELGGARAKIAERLCLPATGVALDLCTGTGKFALELASRSRARVIGVDIVPRYVQFARARAAELGLSDRCHFVCAPQQRLRAWRVGQVSVFLGLCELLESTSLEAVLSELSGLLTPGGTVLVVEEFPEDCQDEQQRLGMQLNEALGYRYVSFRELQRVATQSQRLVLQRTFTTETHRPVLNVLGARDYIAAEAGFSRLDQSAPVDAGLLWAEFEERWRRSTAWPSTPSCALSSFDRLRKPPPNAPGRPPRRDVVAQRGVDARVIARCGRAGASDTYA